MNLETIKDNVMHLGFITQIHVFVNSHTVSHFSFGKEKTNYLFKIL